MKHIPRLSKTITAFVVFSCLGSAIVPAVAARARAERGDWHAHARAAHDWHRQHWRNGGVVYDEAEPNAVFAPPVEVESPPEPGINFVFPLNIH